MSQEELKRVFAFSVLKGSRDLGFNSDYESPFGFDIGNDIPVFKYSLKEVHESIEKPNNIETIGQLFPSQILHVSVESANNPAVSKQDITSKDWKNALKIIEYVTGFQAVVRKHTDEGTWGDITNIQDNYTNWLDYVFRTTQLPEDKYPEYQSCYVDTYIARSATIQTSRKKDRIEFIEFNVTIDGIPKGFKVYFDADSFVSQYASSNFFVYYYKDLNSDDKISQEEFNKQIIDQMNQGLMDKIWKSHKLLTTPYREPYLRGDQIDYKPPVNRTFYVWSNLPSDQFTETIVIEQVRQQLIKDNDDSMDGLVEQYPNLFTDQEVKIYPVHDNIIETKTSGEVVVHPIEYAKIQEVMKRFGLDIVTSANNYKNTEIFHIGTDANINLSDAFIFPLIAADYSPNKKSRPISTRFPSYNPRAFTTIDGSGSKDDIFQFILIQVVAYLSKKIEKEALLNSLNAVDTTLDVKFYEEDVAEPSVEFKYSGTKWTVIWYARIV